MSKYLIDVNLPYYFGLWNNSDFSIKVLYKGTPPKVIHFKFGNLRIKHFHALITKIWPDIVRLISDNNLINVYLDRIEIIK